MSTTYPKVSVIVPVYNLEKYIPRCLTSLQVQTLQEIEFIVVNDGSTDGSWEVMQKFAKDFPNKFLCFSKLNGGLSEARNFGMMHCRGEYIGFVDGDDYVAPNMFEQLYETALISGSDFVTCDNYRIYGNRKKIDMFEIDTVSMQDAMTVCSYTAWTRIIRRSFIEVHNLQFPPKLQYEDLVFTYCMFAHAKRIAHVSTPLYFYIQREGSIMHTYDEKICDIFEGFRLIREYYNEAGKYKEFSETLEYLHARFFLNSSFERICHISEREKRHQLAQYTLNELSELYPRWYDNKYIANMPWRNRLNMRFMRASDMRFLSDIYYLIFQVTDYIKKGRSM